MTVTLLQLQVLNWWSFSYISANLYQQTACLHCYFTFLLINNIGDSFYSSAARKKNINARSLIMRVRTFQPQCPSLCCAWAMQKSFSFNQAEDTMWRRAWQRLATRHQGKNDVAVTNGHCRIRTVLPLARTVGIVGGWGGGWTPPPSSCLQ